MVLKFKGEIMKKSYLIIAILLLLTSCTIKNAEYTFNQGAPDCAQPQVVARGLSESPGNQTGAGSTNSGGAGNTVIIIEETNQDSNSDLDASGVMDAMANKVKSILPSLPSLNPTDKVVPPAVEEEIAEPEALEDAPAGTVEEVD